MDGYFQYTLHVGFSSLPFHENGLNLITTNNNMLTKRELGLLQNLSTVKFYFFDIKKV